MENGLFAVNAAVEEQHWWFVARRQIMQGLVSDLLPANPKTVAVDVGCGTGANIASLAGRYQGVGIDPTPAAITFAQERFPQVKFINGEAPGAWQEMGIKPDIALLMDVLEHVEDAPGLLGKVVAALRPGAFVFITVPADPGLWSQHDVVHHHYRRYTEPTLREVWAGLPVKVRYLSYFNSRLYPLVYAARAAGRALGNARGALGSDIKLPAGPVNSILRRIFAGELNALRRGIASGAPAYRRGVSLIALLERT